MNRVITCSLFVVGAALFMAGCGPENFDAQAFDAAMTNDAVEKDAGAMANEEADEDKDEEKEMPKVATTTIAAPTAVVKLPTRYVRLPSQAQSQVPTISHSREDRQAEQDIMYERNVHIYKPHVNKHLIHKNLMLNNKYHTTIINHPSYRNDVAMSSSVSRTDEVLPTTVVESPTTVYRGFYGYGIGATTYGVRPGCAPYLSGGFYRYCNQVVGPYYR